jgi:predicted protein tyrosine phosphatase
MPNPSIQPVKVLFVCSRNKRRSLAAEKVFASLPGLQVRSAGTQPNARIVVTQGHLGWADIIFVMEKSHLNRLRLKYGETLREKRVIALHIRDDYEFMEPTLVEELVARVGAYLDLGNAG